MATKKLITQDYIVLDCNHCEAKFFKEKWPLEIMKFCPYCGHRLHDTAKVRKDAVKKLKEKLKEAKDEE